MYMIPKVLYLSGMNAHKFLSQKIKKKRKTTYPVTLRARVRVTGWSSSFIFLGHRRRSIWPPPSSPPARGGGGKGGPTIFNFSLDHGISHLLFPPYRIGGNYTICGVPDFIRNKQIKLKTLSTSPPPTCLELLYVLYGYMSPFIEPSVSWVWNWEHLYILTFDLSGSLEWNTKQEACHNMLQFFFFLFHRIC